MFEHEPLNRSLSLEKKLLGIVSTELTQTLLQKPLSLSQQQSIWVGFSGGMDSTVLLFLLHRVIEKMNQSNPHRLVLKALHIHHGISKYADNWVDFCQSMCQKLQIDCQVRYTRDLYPNLVIQSEEEARNARYQIFQQSIAPDNVLCLAHHQTDQAETLLFRLFRGGGLHGISAIPKRRDFHQAVILRPLLGISRENLQLYAHQQNLKWIEDPSNHSILYARNYIRHELLPKIEKRWPKLQQKLSDSIGLFQQQAKLLDELAEIDYQAISTHEGFVTLEKFRGLSVQRQHNFLAWWLRIHGLQVPSQKRIQSFADSLNQCSLDRQFEQKIENYKMLQWKNTVFLIAEDFFKQDAAIFTDVFWQWLESDYLKEENPFVLDLNSHCQIIVKRQLGKGINSQYLKQSKIQWGVPQNSFYLAGHQHSKKIKHIFQEHQIPSWLRANWPALIYQGELVALMGVGCHQSKEADQNELGLAFKIVFNLNQFRKFERSDQGFEL